MSDIKRVNDDNILIEFRGNQVFVSRFEIDGYREWEGFKIVPYDTSRVDGGDIWLNIVGGVAT